MGVGGFFRRGWGETVVKFSFTNSKLGEKDFFSWKVNRKIPNSKIEGGQGPPVPPFRRQWKGVLRKFTSLRHGLFIAEIEISVVTFRDGWLGFIDDAIELPCAFRADGFSLFFAIQPCLRPLSRSKTRPMWKGRRKSWANIWNETSLPRRSSK